MPPKEELFRPFENVVEVSDGEAEFVLEWFGWSGYLWFRPHGAPREVLWFGSFVTSWDSWGATDEQVRQYFEGGVRAIWSRQLFFRIVFLPEEFPAPLGSWVVLQPKKVGVVIREGEHHVNWNTAAFQSLSFDFVRDAPVGVLLNAIEVAIQTDLSEWHNVVRWAQLEPQDRFWSLVWWTRGGASEWIALMSALLNMAIPKQPPRLCITGRCPFPHASSCPIRLCLFK